LALIATVNVLENGAEYSIQNTVQQALFLQTSRDAKYKAKAAIDTFLVRVGDLGSMGLVAVGTALDAGVLDFALANVVAALGWLWIVVRLARRQRNLGAAPSASSSGTGGGFLGAARRQAEPGAQGVAPDAASDQRRPPQSWRPGSS
jgi:AAA family ATP:ADP antiporter